MATRERTKISTKLKSRRFQTGAKFQDGIKCLADPGSGLALTTNIRDIFDN